MGAVLKIDWAGEKHIGVNCLTNPKTPQNIRPCLYMRGHPLWSPASPFTLTCYISCYILKVKRADTGS